MRREIERVNTMKINYNMSAVLSNDHLAKTENSLSKSIERLSSGFKLNRAKDNPSRDGHFQTDACTAPWIVS